jgi:hypothetical protein
MSSIGKNFESICADESEGISEKSYFGAILGNPCETTCRLGLTSTTITAINPKVGTCLYTKFEINKIKYYATLDDGFARPSILGLPWERRRDLDQ